MSRIQTGVKQVVSHHRADHVINRRVVGGNDATTDYQYRCEVYHQPSFNPSIRLFETAEAYRMLNYFKIALKLLQPKLIN